MKWATTTCFCLPATRGKILFTVSFITWNIIAFGCTRARNGAIILDKTLHTGVLRY